MAPRVAKGWTVAAAMLVVSRSGRQPKLVLGRTNVSPVPEIPASPKPTPLNEPERNLRLGNDRLSILIQAYFSTGNFWENPNSGAFKYPNTDRETYASQGCPTNCPKHPYYDSLPGSSHALLRDRAAMTPGQRVCFSIFHEASAIKLGNVHPYASFPDMAFSQFELAARAIGECVDATASDALGSTILACTRAMLDAVQVNTSLGTILLLVPLTRITHLTRLDSSSIGEYRNHGAGLQRASEGLQQLLAGTDSRDCEAIYEAIRIAHPGGLGRSKVADVSENAPPSILDAMRIASSWDDIALQYTNGFSQVYDGALRLIGLRDQGSTWPEAIRRLQLELLARRVDSLIVRKLGTDIGNEVKWKAQQVIASGPFGSPEFEIAWKEFDTYLRHPKVRKNPGTIADLIAGAIYVASLKWT